MGSQEPDESKLLGYRSDGQDWPAGDVGMTLEEIFTALDAITPETAADAQVSLDALSRHPEPIASQQQGS